jgi:hypothetical protein
MATSAVRILCDRCIHLGAADPPTVAIVRLSDKTILLRMGRPSWQAATDSHPGPWMVEADSPPYDQTDPPGSSEWDIIFDLAPGIPRDRRVRPSSFGGDVTITMDSVSRTVWRELPRDDTSRWRGLTCERGHHPQFTRRQLLRLAAKAADEGGSTASV